MSAHRYIFYLILQIGAMFAAAYLIAYSAEQLGLKWLALLSGLIIGVFHEYAFRPIDMIGDKEGFFFWNDKKSLSDSNIGLRLSLSIMLLLAAGLIFFYTEISYWSAALFSIIIGNNIASLMKKLRHQKVKHYE